MVALKVDTFGGMWPALSDELLPGNAAVLSENTWLYSGSLMSLPTPRSIRQLIASDSSKVYRIPATYDRSAYLYNSIWIEFTNADTDVVRAPVFGDVHDRYYYASTSYPPRYNTRARIEAVSKGEPGNQAWLLGINPPTVAPELEVEGGSVKTDNVRVATTVAGVLATDYWEGKVVDGVTLKKDDRIFIKDQADTHAHENGIYVVQAGTGTPPAAVAPVRATDMNTGDKFPNKFFNVMEGTVNGGSSWKITNDPPPAAAPVLGTTAITSEEISELPLQVTRAYVYTWVTEYKEESAPSPPVVATGIQDGSWNLSGMEVPSVLDRGYAADPHAERWITKTRIYRTITSNQGVATFFFVAEQDCTLTSYSDTLKDDEVSSNAQLETFSWTPPPPDLQGLVVMWNGIIAGWRNNELWLCEPYRPHAWPAKHVNTMEYPIIGLGVAGQTLVVCTAGNPVTVNGSVPEAMTTSKVPKFEPCTSRGSILSSAGGVFFTSPNGLILCDQGQAVNVTDSLLTRDKWQFYTRETKLRAAWLGGAYYAFGSVAPGVFELTGPVGIPAGSTSEHGGWAGSHNDFVYGDAALGAGSGFSSGFDAGFGLSGGLVPMPDWISKFDETGAHNGILIDPTDQRIAFNTLTSEQPVFGVQNDPWSGEVFILRDGQVNWLDLAEVNHSLETCVWKSKVFQMPDKKNLGAMRVYFKGPGIIAFEGLTVFGTCRVYADDRLVYERGLMKSGEIWKLPSGFKADFWQYEVETFARVLNIQIASSTKELISV
jgi:hypothetical protein